jgi:hypothetical protein
MQKHDQADLDTVSTRATTSNTFCGSGSDEETRTPSVEPVPDAEEKEKLYESVTESTEAKGSKKNGKSERRHRRSSRPGTNTMLYTKAMYKRRFCAHYPDVDQCKRGSQCAFAHSRAEFRGSLLPEDEEHEGEHSDDFYMNRYKTLWCPIGIQHNWQNCVYAHNYLDIRRNPSIGYGPRQCPHWDKSNSKSAYGERCPNGVRCPYAHGAKEQLYHPAHFKTVVCWDMMSPEGCPRSHLCAFHHNKDECRVEITKDMEYDYTKPLEGAQLGALQKDFNTPPPIGTELDQTKPASQQKKSAPAPRPDPQPAPPTRRDPQVPLPQVPMMVMMMPQAMPHGMAPGMPHGPQPMPLMQVAMHPQMMAGGATPQAAGKGVAPMMPQMMMMPMPQMPHMAQMQQVPEQVGPAVPLTLPNDALPQYGRACEPVNTAYPGTPQCYAPTPAPSPSFRDLCSPTYQSTEAYEQYVRDIMNADGDEFHFDVPKNRSPYSPYQNGKNRMPSSDGSTDEGQWSYFSDHSSNLILSP